MLDRLAKLHDAVAEALQEADDLWIRSSRGSVEAQILSDVGIGLERAAVAMSRLTSAAAPATIFGADNDRFIEAVSALLAEQPAKRSE